MRKMLSSLALVAALAVPSALHATLLNGQFSLQGTVTNHDATTTTPAYLEFLPSSVETGYGTQTGDFGALLTDGEHLSGGTAIFLYNPYTPGSAFLTVGPLTATIETLDEVTTIINGSPVLGFSGLANFDVAGFDSTPGSFTFSTQESGAVTFSATASTVPEPSSLALFGTGILGMAGLVSKKFLA